MREAEPRGSLRHTLAPGNFLLFSWGGGARPPHSETVVSVRDGVIQTLGTQSPLKGTGSWPSVLSPSSVTKQEKKCFPMKTKNPDCGY